MSEMSDFFKRMAENGTKVTGVGPGGAQCDIGIGEDGSLSSEWSGDVTDLTAHFSGPKPFLEQAVDKAIYALGEIISYAEVNRPQGCLNEAKEALALIAILLAQHNDSKGETNDESDEEVDE